MLAGATGMDLVLLVVAADEGVMPQTREHLSILRLLGVPRLAVALTKSDLVEPEWLGLVRDDVQDLLLPTPYHNAPVLPVSSLTGFGLEELSQTLASLGSEAENEGSEDVVRLPIDRVFTIRGAGTVVTGTLWTGRLRVGGKVRVLPGTQEARVRSLQLHGQEVTEAGAGSRVAVGLSGSKVSHQELFRGQNLVEDVGWEVSSMLTCRLSVLSDTGWELEQGQRVRVHLGTAEVLARVALFQGDRLLGGDEGWAQLRLEEPVLARVRDHLVLRSYSPVTTLGGGRVAEVLPRKRRSLVPGEEEILRARLDGSPRVAVAALLEMVGWTGASVSSLPHRTGLPPLDLRAAVQELQGEDGLAQVDDRLFSLGMWQEGKTQILSALGGFHTRNPLATGRPMEELRQVLPVTSGPRLADAILQTLSSEGLIRLDKGVASLSDFRPSLNTEQLALRLRLEELLVTSGLTPPNLRELGESLGNASEIEGILRLMEEDGVVVNLDGEFFFDEAAVRSAGQAVIEALGGSRELGPADFREVLPLSRRHLLPLLRYFDLVGVTTRLGDGRHVARELPEGWGTSRGLAQ
jgi:selenocysteine-specific elongation factor